MASEGSSIITRGQLSRNRSGAVRRYQHISLGYNLRKRKPRIKEERRETPPADIVSSEFCSVDQSDDNSGGNDESQRSQFRRTELAYGAGTSGGKQIEESPPADSPAVQDEEEPEDRSQKEVARLDILATSEPSTEQVPKENPSQEVTTTIPAEEFNRIAREKANQDKSVETIDTPDPYANWPSSEKIPADQRLKYFWYGVKMGYNMALDGVTCNDLRTGQK